MIKHKQSFSHRNVSQLHTPHPAVPDESFVTWHTSSQKHLKVQHNTNEVCNNSQGKMFVDSHSTSRRHAHTTIYYGENGPITNSTCHSYGPSLNAAAPSHVPRGMTLQCTSAHQLKAPLDLHPHPSFSFTLYSKWCQACISKLQLLEGHILHR